MDRKAKISVLAAVIVLALAIGLVGIQYAIPARAASSGDITDWALFDTTNGVDTGAKCGTADKSYDYHATVTAVGGSAVALFTFLPADTYSFPLADGQTVSLTQSGGGVNTPAQIAITQSGGTGKLTGWVSIHVQAGSTPPTGFGGSFCVTTPFP